MRKLESKYPDSIAVVGVHSGKYVAERVTDRIRDASIRLGATHPVVNDRQFRLWRAYAIRAWPTLVAIDPRGYVVGTHAGEFTAAAIEPFIERTLAAAREQGILSTERLHFRPDQLLSARPSTLRYPGKVTVLGDRIAVADSGNHRVLVGRLEEQGRRARIERTVGGTRGFSDGTDAAARFDYPQGLRFDGERTLYVADAENHAIRAVDVESGAVRTIAGTGNQLRTREDLRAGALSSPWDLTLVDRTLFVAMAGSHQIWGLNVEGRGTRIEGSETPIVSPDAPRSTLRIGSGAEELHDGAHAEAALAQPMGITSDRSRLYFVDAETSAVRWAHIDPNGRVATIVGTGLFDMGDKDGVGDEVRMQHPQGIALHADGRLLVADSYNDSLKWVDPTTRRVETWVGGFAEPSGVAIGADQVYVADTNAHRIAIVPLAGGDVTELAIDM